MADPADTAPGRIAHLDGEDVVCVTGYRDVRRAAQDTVTFSNDVLGRIQIPAEDKTRSFRQCPIEFDPPEHRAYRALVEPVFARPREPEYQAQVRALVADAVAAARGAGPIDAMENLALPLQSKALTLLLGVPLEEADVWVSWGLHAFKTRGEPDLARARALTDYIVAKIDAAATAPDDSFFSLLHRVEIDGRPLTGDERLGFAHLVFAGGRDTVIRVLTGILGHFATNPSDFVRLKAEPQLALTATEEFVRLISPLMLIGRIATAPAEVAGLKVAQGQRIALCWAEANRDTQVFDAPDLLKLDRKPNPHVGFGSGIHTCLGAAHARLLCRSLLAELAARVSGIDLVEVREEGPRHRGQPSDLHFAKLVVALT
ncbi:MAG: cytochrome P450 [Paracoccaceae bacterium]|nr:cytochrome P450 [Paracoccaceae bacterium]